MKITDPDTDDIRRLGNFILPLSFYEKLCESDTWKHLGHPYLPESFYKEKFTPILNNFTRIAVEAFAIQRLKKLALSLKDKNLIQDCEELSAARFALYYTGTVQDHDAVQLYGELVSQMPVTAFRKSLGVLMEADEIDEEAKQLPVVTTKEFRRLITEKYTEEDYVRVENLEQIHAHKMFLLLNQKENIE
jgi:hypothetical protein